MTEMDNVQARLDADVAALKQAFADEVAALKSQIATNPQRPANSLDFSSLENLVGQVKAEVAPPTPIPSDHPSLAAGTSPNVSAIGPVSPSPFVDADNDGETGSDTDGDAEIVSAGSTNDQIPAQSSEATSTPATDAASVAAPANDITPSTEGQARHAADAAPAEGDSGHSGATA